MAASALRLGAPRLQRYRLRARREELGQGDICTRDVDALRLGVVGRRVLVTVAASGGLRAAFGFARRLLLAGCAAATALSRLLARFEVGTVLDQVVTYLAFGGADGALVVGATDVYPFPVSVIEAVALRVASRLAARRGARVAGAGAGTGRLDLGDDIGNELDRGCEGRRLDDLEA